MQSPARASSPRHLAYRPDIDGLRAVAVSLVVAYHAFPEAVRGGFIGVDIFFVISGFLISTIICDSLEAGRFRFGGFYGHRVRRIFPPLALMMAVGALAGFYLLLADEYQQLGKHIAGGAGFVANFLLWGESGYFDTAAATKPMLHLWSLGVEEQFYIVWPVILWAAFRLRVNWLIPILAIGLASFALALVQSKANPVADFYSPLTRFWELLTGAFLARAPLAQWLAPARRLPEPARQALLLLVALAGAAMIAAGAALIDDKRPFPSAWALLPVLGTALLLAPGPRPWFNRLVLGNAVVAWIGLISYAFYLWHWPLLSFAQIMVDDVPTVATRLGMVGAAFVLAALSTFLYERPIRAGGHRALTTALLALAMLAVGGTGAYIYAREGFPGRPIVKQAADLETYKNYWHGTTKEEFWRRNPCFSLEDPVDIFIQHHCDADTFPGARRVFLIGDSHSAFLAPGLKPYFRDRKVNLIQFSSAYCIPFSQADSRQRCRDIADYIRGMVAKEKPDTAIVFANYMDYPADPDYRENIPFDQYMLHRIQEFARDGVKHIIVIGQIPTWERGLPKSLLRRFVMRNRPIPDRTYEGITSASLEWDQKLRRLKYPPNTRYVSLRDFLCNAQGCVTRVGPDLKSGLLVIDYGHLSNEGAAYVVKGLLAGILN